MRVHVITRDIDTDSSILARLVAALPSDWTRGDRPDPHADINLYFPYLWYDGFKGTKVAAWFSHLDSERQEKVVKWEEVAQAVDMRVTCAPMYEKMLAKYGPTKIVTPLLDTSKFAPSEFQEHVKPVIGTSGFVYPQGRKGEALFAELMKRVDADFVAMGRGWPCLTRFLQWSEAQTFYQGLDLYVCTSTIEGIGYGPLEALACGVPTVIPRNVGIFDDLPQVQNLYRYDKGDVVSLERAVRAGLSDQINRESLIAICQRFTVAAWQADNVAAMEIALGEYDPEPVGELPAWAGRAGVYVVAYGEPARECARRLIKSVHKHMVGLPVALVSDSPGCGCDIFIENKDEDLGGRSVKTKIYSLAPKEWQYILYLDADTELTQPINFLFDLLVDGWEFAMCVNPAQYANAKEMARPDNQKECEETWKLVGTQDFLQLNGGVFSFRRCPRTETFFSSWHSEWKRYARRDQAALDRALYTRPLRVMALSQHWNCVTRYRDVDPSRAMILHYPMQARRWKGLAPGRLDSPESWAIVHPETDMSRIE